LRTAHPQVFHHIGIGAATFPDAFRQHAEVGRQQDQVSRGARYLGRAID
jgi:hypothetical protein